MREHTFYILRSLLTTAAGVTAALACAIWLSQSLRFLDFIVNRGLSVIDFLQLTLLLLPTVLMATVPVAALCAVIHTYNRLASDRELVALRTAGVSDWGLARPALILGVLFTAVGFALSLYLTPAGFRAFKDEQFLLRSDFSRVLLREGVFNRVGDDLTVYVRARDRNGRLLGILVHDDRNPEAVVTMMAEWGALAANPREPMFVLGKGARQERSADGALTMLYFDSYALDLSPLVETPAARYREPKERYLHELLREPQTVNDRTYRDELVAEAHRRLVTPFDALALSLIAAAAMVAGRFDRRGQWPRIAWGCAGGLTYICGAFALAGLIVKNPALAGVYYALPALACGLSIAAMTRRGFALAGPPRRAAASGI